jgi:PAS domain S-box-containing protein
MSEKDGLQFLKLLKESGRKIPFVMFTGKGGEEIVIKALNLGADGYFIKTGDIQAVFNDLIHGIRKLIEKKMIEETTRDSKLLMSTIFDFVTIGIAYSDTSGRIITVNRWLTEKILGYKSEEIRGRRFTEVGKISGNDRQKTVKAMEKAIATGEHTRNMVITLTRKDGRGVLAEIDISTIKNKGQITGLVTIIRDIIE